MHSLTLGTFLVMWLGFLGLMLAAIAIPMVWAIRSRQFSSQDRARYLPLESGIPGEPEKRQQHEQDPEAKS